MKRTFTTHLADTLYLLGISLQAEESLEKVSEPVPEPKADYSESEALDDFPCQAKEEYPQHR